MPRPSYFIAGAALGAAAVSALARERRLRRSAERFAAAGLESLLRAIDANDPQTGAHVRRVAAYSLVLADAMSVSDSDRRTIELTALFHDVGKIHEALFDIVHEPRKLTPAERRAIATHPARGAEVLAPIANFHPLLAKAVMAHHERWDGNGYPRGLQGSHIPLAARIVTIADTFDAITQRRRYRDARSTHDAIAIIANGAGSQFDPVLVDLLLLPPVLQRFIKLHRLFARRGDKLPPPRRKSEPRRMPKVRVRWRSRSQMPEGVRVRESAGA